MVEIFFHLTFHLQVDKSRWRISAYTYFTTYSPWLDCATCRAFRSWHGRLRHPCSMRLRGRHPFRRVSRFCSCSHFLTWRSRGSWIFLSFEPWLFAPHRRFSWQRHQTRGCSPLTSQNQADYSGAAEPPVRKNGSHHSRPREPPIYSSFVWSNSACCCRAGFHKPVRASRLPTSSLEAHAML